MKAQQQHPTVTSLIAGEAAIELTDGQTDGQTCASSPQSSPSASSQMSQRPSARQGVFALIYTTEPSDTVEVIEITPAFSDKLINAGLN